MFMAGSNTRHCWGWKCRVEASRGDETPTPLGDGGALSERLILECEEDRDADRRDLADLGLQPGAVPPLSRSRGLSARAAADLPRPDLEFSRARGRDAEPRRFPHYLCRR